MKTQLILQWRRANQAPCVIAQKVNLCAVLVVFAVFWATRVPQQVG